MNEGPFGTKWNYRVMRTSLPGDTYMYAIHEVYYRGDQINAHSVNPVAPAGETPEELAQDLAMMTAAMNQAILDPATYKEVNA